MRLIAVHIGLAVGLLMSQDAAAHPGHRHAPASPAESLSNQTPAAGDAVESDLWSVALRPAADRGDATASATITNVPPDATGDKVACLGPCCASAPCCTSGILAERRLETRQRPGLLVSLAVMSARRERAPEHEPPPPRSTNA